MKKAFIFITFIAFVLAVGCSKKNEDDSGITSVVYENMKFAQNEDIENFMATIHDQAPKYASTEKQIKQAFNKYDMKYTMEGVKVIEKSDQNATVKFFQKAEKINGPAFRNYKVVGVHILKKSGGKWKIYSTSIEKLDYLD